MADNSIGLNADFGPLKKSIDGLITSLGKLDSTIERVEKSSSVFDNLFGNVDNFKEFAKAVAGLNADSTDAFGSIARGLSKLGEAFKTLGASNFNIENFKLFTTEIFELLISINGIGLNLDKNTINSLNAVAKAFQAIAVASQADLSKINISKESITSISLLINTLAGLPSGAPEKVGILGTVLNSVKGLFAANVGNTGTQNLSVVSESLLNFSRAIKGLNTNIQDVDVKQIVTVFTKLAGALQIVSFVLSKLPGGNEIEEFSKTFQRLGIGLSGIARGVEGLDNAAIVTLVKTLTVLSGAIKIVSAITRFGGDKNAEGLTKILSGVIGALVELNKISTFKNQQQLTVSLGEQLKFITQLVASFKSLRGAEIPDVSNILKAITEVFKLLGSDTIKFDPKALDTFDKFTDRMVKNLQKLNAIKVDTAKAVAIGQQVEALTKLSNIESKLENLNKALTFGVFLQSIPNILNGVASIASAIGNLPNVVAAALKSAGNELNTFGNSLINQGQRILQTFSLKSLTESGGFDIASQFLSLSKQLEVFGNLTKDQIKQAQDFADTIGIKYPLSANDALQATLDLTKAGQDLTSTFKILPSAADLASLSDSKDIKATTAALIAAEGAFKEFSDGVAGTFDNISKAADILAAGADVSTASIDSLSQGLANSARAADDAGLNYQDTVAALALLDKAQIKGAEGGTALRSALNAIFTRDKAKDEFKKLGIAIFDTAGNVRDFDSILKDLNKRFSGFTQKQIIESLSNVADTFGRTALSVLVLNNGLSDTVDAMNKTGTAAQKAQNILDNFDGDVEQLKGSFETLLKDIFIPMIERAFRPFVQVLRQVTDFILRLPQPVKEAASTFIFLAASITTLVGSLSIGLGVFAKLSGLFLTVAGNAVELLFNIQKLALIFSGFATSLLVVLPVITAIGVGLALLSEEISSAFRFVEENVGGAGEAFDQLRKTVESVFGEISRIVTTAATALQVVFREFFGRSDNQRGSALAHTFDTISKSISSFVLVLKNIDTTALVSFFTRLRISVENFVASFLSTVKDVSTAVGDFIGPIRDAFGRLIPEVQKFIDNFVAIFVNVGDEVKDFPLAKVIAAVVNFVKTTIVGQIDNITRILTVLNNIIVPIIKNIPIFIANLKIFLGTVVDIFRPIIDFVLNQASIVINFFKSLPGLLSDLPNAGQIVRQFGEDFIKGLLNLPKAIGSTLENIGLKIGSEILFFLGNGLVTGDFTPLVNGLLKTIGNFLKSIPTFFVNFGKQVGNEFITNFGLALQNSDLSTIINSFLDIISNLLFEGVQKLASFLGDGIRLVLSSLFSSGEAQSNILFAISDLLDTLTAPVRLALTVFARGLNIGAVATEIASSFVRNVVRAILDLIPNIIITVANSFGDGIAKSLLIGFADGVKILVNALSNILAFPLKLLGSAFNAFSTFLDLLDKIGITKGVTLLAITAVTLALTGLGDAIITFARQVTLNLIQPAIIALQSLLFQIKSFAGAVLEQAKTAILAFVTTMKNAFTSAFTSSIAAGASVLETGFTGLASSIFTLGKSGFSGVVAGLKGIASGIKGLIAAAAPLLTVVALITEVKGVLDALTASANGLPFLRTFIQSVGDSLLSLVGLDQLIPRFHEGLDILQGLLEAFAQQVGRNITQIFVTLLQGFNDLRARLEQASADLGLSDKSKFAEQFFAVGDTINNAGKLSGKEFFAGLGEALNDPADLNALKSQLFVAKSIVVDQFKTLIDPDTGRFLAETTSDQLKQIGKVIENSGAIPEALRTVNKNFREEIALFNTFSPEAQSANFSTFFNNLIKSGIDKTSLDLEPLRDRIIEELDKGSITQDQASKFLDALGFSASAIDAAAGELSDRFAVLSKSTEDLFKEAQQSTLDDLNQQLKDGKISADEYADSLNKLGDEIVNTVEGIREEKVAALTKQFDEGSISEEEFRKQFEAINQEAQSTTLDQLQEEINRISTLAQQGGISFEDAAKQIQGLNDKIDQIQPATGKVKELQDALQKLTEDFGAKAISATKFAEEFQRITAAIEEAKHAADVPANTGNNGGLTGLFKSLFDNQDNTNGITPGVPTDEDLDNLKEELSLKEKIADFDRNEARKLQDDIREEEKARDKIGDIQTESDQKMADDQAKFELDRQRAEQDHQDKLLEIAKSGNDQFNDAIAGRDASAAQAAQKSIKDQTSAENKQFSLSQQRAQEDFNIQRAAAIRERDAKILEAQQSLQDLIDKNARERAQRLEDEQIEVDRIKAKNSDDLAAQVDAEKQQQDAAQTHQLNLKQIFEDGLTAIDTAVANGLPGIAGLFTNTFVNLTNQLAQIAGIQQQQIAGAGGQAPVFAPPMAKGGNIKANKPYQVRDTNNPEVFTDQNGKSYLISPRSGFIIPQVKQRMAGAGGGNIVIDVGGINVNGANQDPLQIASAIEQMITGRLKSALENQLSGKRKL